MEALHLFVDRKDATCTVSDVRRFQRLWFLQLPLFQRTDGLGNILRHHGGVGAGGGDGVTTDRCTIPFVHNKPHNTFPKTYNAAMFCKETSYINGAI